MMPHVDMRPLPCPLCAESSARFAVDRQRAYFQCSRCELVFADPAAHLDHNQEKARYDQHQNHPADAGYRRFLNQLAGPLLSRLEPGMRGLDYGCGPGPTLSVMLEEAGMHVQLYDPYFAPDPSVLDHKYDFVTCTEVAEHFYQPARDWAQLAGLLAPGSWLGVMTALRDPSQPFANWQYKNDLTHVSFYSSTTLAWLAVRYGLSIEYQSGNAILFQRVDPAPGGSGHAAKRSRRREAGEVDYFVTRL